MKRACYWLLLATAICVAPGALHAQGKQQAQVRVEMNADRKELSTGDQVAVRIYVQAQGAGQPEIAVPEFDGFQVVQRSVQRPMQFSFGFGQSQPVVTSTTQYTFVLVPMGVGTFKIPPVRVTVGQRVFQSEPLVLTVRAQPGQPGQAPLAGGQQPAAANPVEQTAQPAAAAAPAAQNSGDVAVFDQEAFLRTVVDKTEPFEGEQVTATIYLYTRHNLQQVPAVQTEASTDGLWVQDLLSATRSLEPTRQVINGRGFWVYVLRRFAGFPLRSGDLTLGAMALTISRESVFDLFDPNRGQPADVQRSSVPVLLHVKPLPPENKPQGAVAVGSFEIKSELDRKQVVTGDAVTWTATVRGKGNLRGLKLPDPTVTGLQVLQPEVHDLTEAPGDRVQSTRTFAWLVVPQAPGSYELPALSLHTFDPETGTYKTVKSERTTLTAAGAARAGAGAVATGTPGKPAQPDDANGGGEQSEVWPPVRAHSELQRHQSVLASRTFYPFALLLWPLLWLGSVLGPVALTRYRARGNESGERLALRSARQRFSAAESALNAHDPRGFHAELAAAFNITLEARLGEAVSGLTQNELRSRLAQRGIPETLASGIGELLAQCDFARFSSASVDDAEMRSLFGRAQRLWAELTALSPVAIDASAPTAARATGRPAVPKGGV